MQNNKQEDKEGDIIFAEGECGGEILRRKRGKGLEDQMEREKRWYEQMQPKRQETANAERKGMD